MTDWHITGIIRGRHETNITSRCMSAGAWYYWRCVHSFACMCFYIVWVLPWLLFLFLSHAFTLSLTDKMNALYGSSHGNPSIRKPAS